MSYRNYRHELSPDVEQIFRDIEMYLEDLLGCYIQGCIDRATGKIGKNVDMRAMTGWELREYYNGRQGRPKSRELEILEQYLLMQEMD